MSVPRLEGRHLVVDGSHISLEDVVAAEVRPWEDVPRMAVLLVITLVAPIALMVVAVACFNGSVLWGLWFGPALLVGTVVCGLVGAAVGLAWKKPWGVVVERQDKGHERLIRTGDEASAKALAKAIMESIPAH